MLARTCLSLLLLAAIALWPTALLGQAAPNSAPNLKSTPKSTPKSEGAKQRSPVGGPIRSLAPGVETTIKPDRSSAETYSSHFPDQPHNRQVVEILRGAVPGLHWQPNFYPRSETLEGDNKQTGQLEGMAANAVYRRQIWYLEFTFKPLRMMWIDIPQPSGKMARKLVWYLVYRVKNTGDQLVAVRDTEGTGPTLAQWSAGDKQFKKDAFKSEEAYKNAFKIEKRDGRIWFLPRFVLKSEEPELHDKAYLSRVMPAAIPAIQLREDPKRRLLSTVEISSRTIPLSKGREDKSVWGVATWVDMDPRMDKFSIYVEGLTNAYRWWDVDDKVRPLDKPKIVLRDDEGKPLRKPLRHERVMRHKTLRLKFWRPGDEFYQNEREIRFGAPPGSAKGTLDYEWAWR